MSLPANFVGKLETSTYKPAPYAAAAVVNRGPPRPSSQHAPRKRASVLAAAPCSPRNVPYIPHRPSTPATVPLSARGPFRPSKPVAQASGSRPNTPLLSTPRPTTPALVPRAETGEASKFFTALPEAAPAVKGPLDAWDDGAVKEERPATPSTTRGPHARKDADVLDAGADAITGPLFSELRARDIADMAKRSSRERVGFLLGRAPLSADPPAMLKKLRANTPIALCVPGSTSRHFHSIDQIADASSFRDKADHSRRRDRMTEWVEVMMKQTHTMRK